MTRYRTPICSVQSFSHVWFVAEAAPSTGSSGDGTNRLIGSSVASMLKYPSVDQAVPAMWRSLVVARSRADWPSGSVPTTRVRRLISLRMRSRGLLVRIMPPVLLRSIVLASAGFRSRNEIKFAEISWVDPRTKCLPNAPQEISGRLPPACLGQQLLPVEYIHG